MKRSNYVLILETPDGVDPVEGLIQVMVCCSPNLPMGSTIELQDASNSALVPGKRLYRDSPPEEDVPEGVSYPFRDVETQSLLDKAGKDIRTGDYGTALVAVVEVLRRLTAEDKEGDKLRMEVIVGEVYRRIAGSIMTGFGGDLWREIVSELGDRTVVYRGEDF